MLKRIIIINLALVALFAAFAWHARTPRAPAGTYRVTYSGWPGASCSGVVVSDTLMVTARHCVLDPLMPFPAPILFPVFIHGGGAGRLIEGRVVGFDGSRDIGLIKGDFTKLQKAKVNFTSGILRADENYQACGYPFGQPELICINIGKPGLNDLQPNDIWTKFAASIFFGMSGGGVYGADNVLVAVNSIGYTDGGCGVTPTLGLGPLITRVSSQ